MKNYRIYFAIAVLVLASLACQALGGGGGNANPPEAATAANGNGDSGGGNVSSTGFPMTDDAFNVTEVGDGSLLYYTRLSLGEVMQFYRDEYTAKGYKERELLTVVSDTTFSMVFDGDPSGKAVVIQSVDLGDSRTVAVRLEGI